jgi:predicted membrane chloride channel (bestrophin family)
MGIGGSTKHRPLVAGGGENIPLEIVRSLSDWIATLENRGTVPGPALGGMHGCLTTFEDSLGVLERILTTPLPFVYAAHIRHTVWIYLFFLPFQLTETFGYLAIPGVAVASFLYLGFLAAGEEIEQPFGYDFNDLQLDLFCHEIIHRDLVALTRTPCANSTLNSSSRIAGNRPEFDDQSVVSLARVQQAKQAHNTTGNITGLIFE